MVRESQEKYGRGMGMRGVGRCGSGHREEGRDLVFELSHGEGEGDYAEEGRDKEGEKRTTKGAGDESESLDEDAGSGKLVRSVLKADSEGGAEVDHQSAAGSTVSRHFRLHR